MFEPTLDEVCAAAAVRWDVGYSDDAVNPLSVHDSLVAAGNHVAGELDALANKAFRYLTKTYLPRKLKAEDRLD